MTSCRSIAHAGTIVLAVLLSLFAMQAHAGAAATVLFSHGHVQVESAAGAHRALHKGDDVRSGDTIITGRPGRVQMRFSDGGLVSLMPGTTFVVRKYQQPDAESDGSLVFNLVEGGLRTLTGSIGHKDHDDYKLKTSVATLGIRGTQYNATKDDDAMRAHVGQGKVELYNDEGSKMLSSGENGVAKPGQAPHKTDKEPLYTPHISSVEYGGPPVKDEDKYTRNARAGNALVPYFGGIALRDPPPEDINGTGPDSEGHSGGGGASGGGNNILGKNGFSIASVDSSSRTVTSKNGGSVPSFVPAGAQPGMAISANPPEVHVDNGLVWGEVLNTPATTFHYYVWGDPATNVPVTGRLSYSLAKGAVRTENHGAATLDAFDLNIKLGGVNSPSFKANVKVSGIPAAATTLSSTVNFNMDYFQSGSWNDAQHTAFEFHARKSSACTWPCQSLNVSGILSGNGASEAGVAFHYATASHDVNLEGVAVLDKQP